MAIAALILGILSVVFCWVPFVGLAMGIVALILGALELKKKPEKKGVAIGGLVLGIIGGVISIFYLIFWIIAMMTVGSMMHAVGNMNADDLKKAAEDLMKNLPSNP